MHITSPATGQFLKYNSPNWVNVGIALSDIPTLTTQLSNKLDATASQSANTVLAGPSSGGAAAPSFRALVANDLPSGGYDQTYFKNGMNNIAAATTIGNSGSYDFTVMTNSAPRVTVLSSGNVGVQTTAPVAALDVSGQIRSQPYNAGTSTSIDWNNGNNQYTAPSGNACGAIALSNLLDGGSYTLTVQGVTSGTCAFSSSGLTFVYSPQNMSVYSDALYTMLRVGNKVYVSWVTGFLP